MVQVLGAVVTPEHFSNANYIDIIDFILIFLSISRHASIVVSSFAKASGCD